MGPEELTFLLVLLCAYVFPACYFVGVRIAKEPKKSLKSKFFVGHLFVLIFSFCLVQQLYTAINTSGSSMFDPYEILGVREYATKKTIRKAYRKLSIRLHPDKRQNDPLAQSEFTRLAKAYEALTDPVGKDNYKKYGHPDGRQYYLVDFKAISGQTGFFIVGIVYGAIALVGFGMALNNSADHKPKIDRDTVERLMSNWRDRMTQFDVLELIIQVVKQPLEEKSTGGGCCGGGGGHSTYTLEEEVEIFLQELEKKQIVSVIDARNIRRVEKDHVKRDLVALYYHTNSKNVSDITVPAQITKRYNEFILQIPYLLEVFADLSIANSADNKQEAQTVLVTLRLMAQIAQGTLVADSAAIQNQRSRLKSGNSTTAKSPKLILADINLTVEGEDDIQAQDWITMQLKIIRAHIEANKKADWAGTIYDQFQKNFEYSKEHLWVVLKDAQSHTLYGAWKVNDLSQEINDSLGFWAPSAPAKYKVEVRILSTTYIDVETSHGMDLEVLKPPPIIEEIIEQEF